jgi:hypothetical protein
MEVARRAAPSKGQIEIEIEIGRCGERCERYPQVQLRRNHRDMWEETR